MVFEKITSRSVSPATYVGKKVGGERFSGREELFAGRFRRFRIIRQKRPLNRDHLVSLKAFCHFSPLENVNRIREHFLRTRNFGDRKPLGITRFVT